MGGVFEKEHEAFIERHLSVRAGEGRGRLARGHHYAEKLLLQNVVAVVREPGSSASRV
ncbi:hypothetical protein D3C73_1095610 [compost metagenome]